MDENYWELRSAEASNTANPNTFWIPPSHERKNLKIGQAAKLIFDIEAEHEGGGIENIGERMWVIVSEIGDGYYIGILDDNPAFIEPARNFYLCFGAEVPFLPEHVIDIADPPPEYVRWQLSQEPERRWPRK